MTWPPSDSSQPSKSEGNKYEKEHFHPEYPATGRENRDYPRMDVDFLENSSKTSLLFFQVPLKKARFPHLRKTRSNPPGSAWDCTASKRCLVRRNFSNSKVEICERQKKQSRPFSSWWLNQPIWKIWVKSDHFPRVRVENVKIYETTTQWLERVRFGHQNISHQRRLSNWICSNMTGREIQGWCFSNTFPILVGAFLNQPVWKICASQNGNHLPQIIGVKIHKIWTNHHLGQFGLLGIVGWCREK